MDKITIENGLLALKERFGNENSYDAVEFIERVEKEIEQLQAENQQLNEDKSLLINDWQNAIQEVEQLKAENDEFRKTILELQEEVEFYKTNDNVCAVTVKGEISEKARKYDELQQKLLKERD